MENNMQCKGFAGSVIFNAADGVFHGKIERITDLVTFETTNVEEVLQAFEEAVEDYLELCEQLDKRPEKF